MAKLKKVSPDASEETVVTIAASGGTELQLVVSVIEAVVATPSGEELFPDVEVAIPTGDAR